MKQSKKTALSLLLRWYNKKLQQNISKEELAAFIRLSKNKDILTQTSDKVNSVVIFDKGTYIKRLKNLLNNQRKFENASIKKMLF